MHIRSTFIHSAMIMMVAAIVFSIAAFAGGKEAPPVERPVPYKIMNMRDYQIFLKNWDEKKDPVLYAMISNTAQYDDLFHPAPIMGPKRPFSPDDSLYIRENILLIARVMPSPDNPDRIFDIERITERNHELSLYYRYNEEASDAKWKGKICLAIRIPKRCYKKVHFFENDRKIGELNLMARQWLHPERRPSSRSLHD